ncbi:uncharacterized protein (DUF2384 family) [Bosea sp. OAE752]|uniref:antitoxin Xre/MbcA/ParS toxin-binding domain-containing protein n=1 Tax=Bosea sp. OAE752 TaxID=2663873 RepID=UPI003D1CC0F9
MRSFVVIGRGTVVLLSSANASPPILAIGADVILVRLSTKRLARNPNLARFLATSSPPPCVVEGEGPQPKHPGPCDHILRVDQARIAQNELAVLMVQRPNAFLARRLSRNRKILTARRGPATGVRRHIATTGPHLNAAGFGSVSFTRTELQAAVRAVIRLFKRWGVPDRDALRILRPLPRAAYRRWKHDEIDAIDHELGVRLSVLISIHMGLRLFFKEPSRGYRWVKAPNAVFNGRRPLDLMMTGNLRLLLRLRAYLHDHFAGR